MWEKKYLRHMGLIVMIFCWSNVRSYNTTKYSCTYQNLNKDGFILDTNNHDSLPLDDILLPLLKQPLKHRLDHAGYLGYYLFPFPMPPSNQPPSTPMKANVSHPSDYHLIPTQGLCHRTAVAIRTLTLSFRNWKRYIAGLSVDDPEDEVKADKFVVERILEVYAEEASHALSCLNDVGKDIGEGQKDVLVRRWGQIGKMVEGVREQSRALIDPKISH